MRLGNAREGETCCECGEQPELMAYLGEYEAIRICRTCAGVALHLHRNAEVEATRQRRIGLLKDVLREFGNTDSEIKEVVDGVEEMFFLEDEDRMQR